MDPSAINSTRSSTLGLIGMNTDALASELGGDINAQVAAMVMIAGREKRAQIQQSRRAEERLIESMEDQQVDEMRQQAEDIRSAGRWEGLGTIVGGGLTIGAGAAQIVGATKAGEAAEEWKGGATMANGAASVAEGGGKVIASGYEKSAKMHEAEATAADNTAAAARRRLEDLRDEAKSAEEDQRSAIDFLRDINQSAGAADRAAIFQRA
jgi:hypothetical protein